MGGMQALQWAVQYPDAVRSVIALATTLAPLRAADRLQRDRAAGRDGRPELARRRLLRWRAPVEGLAVARMLGHVTYLSDAGMRAKFGRRLRTRRTALRLRARVRGRELSAITRAGVSSTASTRTRSSISPGPSTTSTCRGRAHAWPTPSAPARGVPAPVVLVRLAVPAVPARRACRTPCADGRRVTYHEIPSDYGHDAFLLEHEAQDPIVRAFLGRPPAMRVLRDNRRHICLIIPSVRFPRRPRRDVACRSFSPLVPRCLRRPARSQHRCRPEPAGAAPHRPRRRARRRGGPAPRLVARGALRHVHPLGPLRDARPASGTAAPTTASGSATPPRSRSTYTNSSARGSTRRSSTPTSGSASPSRRA